MNMKIVAMNEHRLKAAKDEFQHFKIPKDVFSKGVITDLGNDNPERASMWVLHCEDVAYARNVMKEIQGDKLKKLTKEIGKIYEFARLIGIDL